MFDLTHFLSLFQFLHLGPLSLYYLHIKLFNFLLWHTIFYSYVIWVLNWQFNNLPLTFVLIPGFAYFIFSMILFRKNIHLLLFYPKHVIKLSGYKLEYYMHS